MAGKKRKEVRSRDVVGLNYLERLRPLLERLRDVGCERDRAGNRQLFYDDYCMLVLLFLFNPVVCWLRCLQQASELKKVQRLLRCPRASLGSLSESVEVFDSARLQEIIQELGEQLQPVGRDQRLKDVQHTLTLVDGTLITALPRLMEASFLYQQNGKGTVRWRCYVMDRGFAKFTLFNQINAAGSSYVCRLRDNSRYEISELRSLNAEAESASILEDAIVNLGAGCQPEARPDHPIRIITIAAEPHRKRKWYGKTGPACDGFVRLATNLSDVPAEVIALIYRYRWSIEIFFRFFKHILGCRHLLSHDENVLRHHRLHADQPLDRTQTDAADL